MERLIRARDSADDGVWHCHHAGCTSSTLGGERERRREDAAAVAISASIHSHQEASSQSINNSRPPCRRPGIDRDHSAATVSFGAPMCNIRSVVDSINGPFSSTSANEDDRGRRRISDALDGLSAGPSEFPSILIFVEKQMTLIHLCRPSCL